MCLELRNIKHFPCWYRVISTRVEIGKTRNVAQRALTEEWREIFRVDIELYQHGS